MIDPITLGLIATAIGLAVGVTVAVYWKNIKEWLGRVWQKLPTIVKGYLQGALAFIQRIGSTIKNIMKYYSYNKETKKWNETIVSQKVNESTIPDHIRNRIKQTNKEIDITHEMEKELYSLTL